jgi:hypothetical protein
MNVTTPTPVVMSISTTTLLGTVSPASSRGIVIPNATATRL